MNDCDGEDQQQYTGTEPKLENFLKMHPQDGDSSQSREKGDRSWVTRARIEECLYWQSSAAIYPKPEVIV
jgi:hypothetical protein